MILLCLMSHSFNFFLLIFPFDFLEKRKFLTEIPSLDLNVALELNKIFSLNLNTLMQNCYDQQQDAQMCSTTLNTNR